MGGKVIEEVSGEAEAAVDSAVGQLRTDGIPLSDPQEHAIRKAIRQRLCDWAKRIQVEWELDGVRWP